MTNLKSKLESFFFIQKQSYLFTLLLNIIWFCLKYNTSNFQVCRGSCPNPQCGGQTAPLAAAPDVDSYGAPQAPAIDSYGAPQAPAIDSYGAPQASPQRIPQYQAGWHFMHL